MRMAVLVRGVSKVCGGRVRTLNGMARQGPRGQVTRERAVGPVTRERAVGPVPCGVPLSERDAVAGCHVGAVGPAGGERKVPHPLSAGLRQRDVAGQPVSAVDEQNRPKVRADSRMPPAGRPARGVEPVPRRKAPTAPGIPARCFLPGMGCAGLAGLRIGARIGRAAILAPPVLPWAQRKVEHDAANRG